MANFNFRDVAKVKEIAEAIGNYKGPYKRQLDTADVVPTSRLNDSKTLLYFSYEVDSDLLKRLEDEFTLKIANTFRYATFIFFSETSFISMVG